MSRSKRWHHLRRGAAGGALALTLAAGLVACGSPASDQGRDQGQDQGEDGGEEVAVDRAPDRFRIVPDDYHVPYAGTAEDGRRFFLSDELFAGDSAYVGLFLWKADGTFDEVRVDAAARPDDLPIGQAGSVGAEELVDARLAELGDYVLEPIEVEPFIEVVDNVKFGWHVGRYDDGSYFINIEPGDFIAYYAPWDGLEYDT